MSSFRHPTRRPERGRRSRMSRHRRALIYALVLSVLVGGPALAQGFTFNPSQTYDSVDESEPLVEFPATIRTSLPQGEDLLVDIEPVLPDGWLGQFCQESTGVCYLDDAVITLEDNDPDVLRFDFICPPGDVGKGWIDVRVSRVSDPSTWIEHTFALGHGVTLPEPDYIFRCEESFKQADPTDVVEFFCPLVSFNGYPDSLICKFENDVPGDWFSQYCQVSTGVCYFGDVTIAFPAMISDEIRLDMITGPDPGIGTARLKVQSKANPAIWREVQVRARTGDHPADVADLAAPERFRVEAAPNPLRNATDLRVMLQRPAAVSVRIVDLNGRTVRTRAVGRLEAGVHPLRWDGTDDAGNRLPDGVYFYRVDAGAESAGGKLTLRR
ncbi:MAG: hypothetical protein GF346_06380 [Candidatus Eisenbacteria bacterium]|nr:hypothetical protein [Candidatus Latescibacterota bacterium]MBD3302053.1 hypothetical protein [Candidatus Eisenbacteria bacterium]